MAKWKSATAPEYDLPFVASLPDRDVYHFIADGKQYTRIEHDSHMGDMVSTRQAFSTNSSTLTTVMEIPAISLKLTSTFSLKPATRQLTAVDNSLQGSRSVVHKSVCK